MGTDQGGGFSAHGMVTGRGRRQAVMSSSSQEDTPIPRPRLAEMNLDRGAFRREYTTSKLSQWRSPDYPAAAASSDATPPSVAGAFACNYLLCSSVGFICLTL